ncbi:hypothetical protein [Tenacibaculum maritimum]|uniref:hypothetical protein n=1 Tax=Tenacibaculum maritimum TaxID=107401 RepID=UPI0012E58E20|nr:hypothetical protein [Tenacibaculum maritimum]MCD9583737.1 hypothetical protein [Tenacibaculum maritimum]MCD9619465.1 hypothetical protein [Tenacibaculum maritimum]MCD9626193.1 hypothetical protein [Tenacibaculum maritimum]MCD9629185.1 hypothetical protein [Tenacibaculum maritimum]MCD9631594.1 hypothetical protein [Tenacibaculum maritimum]
MKFKIIYLVFFVMILQSCQSKIESKALEIQFKNSKSEVLFRGRLNEDNNPTGIWSFYDEDLNNILTIYFGDSIESPEFSFEMMSKEGKMIHFSHYIEGVEIERKECFDYQKINYENGRYIFRTFLEGFFISDPRYREKLRSLSKKKLFDKINSISKENDIIPDFTNNELEAVYKYLHNDRISSAPLPRE